MNSISLGLWVSLRSEGDKCLTTVYRGSQHGRSLLYLMDVGRDRRLGA